MNTSASRSTFGVCRVTELLDMEHAQAVEELSRPDGLRRADERILNTLSGGRAAKRLPVDETGFSRNMIYN